MYGRADTLVGLDGSIRNYKFVGKRVANILLHAENEFD
jgi:hypothetical protein